MNVNKKFNRLRQWGKEKMGGDIKSGTSDDFKALENEMNVRNEGLEKMHTSMTAFVKSLNKRIEGDNRERMTAISSLGSSMAKHGGEFEEDSGFGRCLTNFGLANERIGRAQDVFATQAGKTWLDALERSLVQMKEYQNARKKLESRRLAYDTTLVKVQKARNNDYQMEEEVRTQRAKFEESTEDVQRRMQDILESEQANVGEMQAFFEAELAYHERCREILLHLRKTWPQQAESGKRLDDQRRVHGLENNSSLPANTEEDNTFDLRLPKLAFNTSRSFSGNSAPQQEANLRSMTCKMGSEILKTRVETPLALSTASWSSSFRTGSAHRTNLPPANEDASADEDDADTSSSPDQQSVWESSLSTRSSSPATSISCGPAARSRNGSWSAFDNSKLATNPNTSCNVGSKAPSRVTAASSVEKKVPPPPPPSRTVKPKPPPPAPPMKRSALSTSAIPCHI